MHNRNNILLTYQNSQKICKTVFIYVLESIFSKVEESYRLLTITHCLLQ